MLHESDHQCVLAIIEEEKKTEVCRSSESLQARIKLYSQEREQRLQNFFSHVQTKRHKFLENLLSNNKACSEVTK